jgi:hypothetical protein
MKQDMVHHGFDATMVDHDMDLMAPPMTPDAPTASARKDLGEETPPTQLKLVPPDGTKNAVPKLYQADGNTYTCAGAVIRMYKEKAVDKQKATGFLKFNITNVSSPQR